MGGLECCLCIRIWFFDIFLPLVEKAGELLVLSFLIQRHEYKWALTLAIIMVLPGFIETIYWTAICCCGGSNKFHKCCQWLFFFNPILFPFTLVAWHVIVSCQSEEKIKEKYAMSKVLRSIQVQTESFLTLLLLSHVLSHQFALDREDSIIQMALMLLAICNLAKDCAEHHFHEISGKSYIPYCNQVLPTILFYMLQIALRLPSLALLTIYLGDWFGLFLAALLPVNFTLASLNLKTLTAKNVWTGLMSTLAPVCFVAKAKIKDHISKITSKSIKMNNGI